MAGLRKGGRQIDDAVRDQEVLRANKELAAYFHGQRTEREARAALKIIKAFIRDRERANPANRRPLPAASAKPHVPASKRSRSAGKRTVKTTRRTRPVAPAPDPIPSSEPGEM